MVDNAETWLFYLSGATAVFEHGGMCNYQIQYTRSRRALPLTRDYIAEAEQELMDRAAKAQNEGG